MNGPIVKVVAIHQPNFFPWLGYFDKIRRSDSFVFMDDVSYPKSGKSMGSWCNRVKMLINGKSSWVGIPVVREHGMQLIRNVLIDDRTDWREKLVMTLECSYKKSPGFMECWDFVHDLLAFKCGHLADFNIHCIKGLMGFIGIESNCMLQSAMGTKEGSTRLLIEIIGRVGGHRYLCGGGSQGYLEESLFGEAGITLEYQEYRHPIYEQRGGGEFIPGLSILDALFNCGRQKTAGMISAVSQA